MQRLKQSTAFRVSATFISDHILSNPWLKWYCGGCLSLSAFIFTSNLVTVPYLKYKFRQEWQSVGEPPKEPSNSLVGALELTLVVGLSGGKAAWYGIMMPFKMWDIVADLRHRTDSWRHFVLSSWLDWPGTHFVILTKDGWKNKRADDLFDRYILRPLSLPHLHIVWSRTGEEKTDGANRKP